MKRRRAKGEEGGGGGTLSSVRLAEWLVAYGLPRPVLEWKFHFTRRWRTDLGWPSLGIAVEIEGGVYTRGRHTSPAGFVNDMEKYNALAVLGIFLIRILPSQVELSDPAKREGALGASRIGEREAGGAGGRGGRKKKTLSTKNRWKQTPAHEIIMELFNQRGL